jgi:hypothetical protein
MSGSARGREALIWQTAMGLQGSRVSSAVSIRCLDTRAPLCQSRGGDRQEQEGGRLRAYPLVELKLG